MNLDDLQIQIEVTRARNSDEERELRHRVCTELAERLLEACAERIKIEVLQSDRYHDPYEQNQVYRARLDLRPRDRQQRQNRNRGWYTTTHTRNDTNPFI